MASGLTNILTYQNFSISVSNYHCQLFYMYVLNYLFLARFTILGETNKRRKWSYSDFVV